jgi:hypothetical protein
MRKLNDNPIVNVVFQMMLEVMEIREILKGQKGFALVGLAVRPGCSVVINPKEVQGLIFNYQIGTLTIEN